MTKTRRFSLALLATALCATLAPAAPHAVAQSASQPLSADAVAARVQAFYDRTETIEARFSQTFYHRMYDRYQRSAGQLVVDKPGRMRFDYDQPNGKVFVSDGRHLTAYEPGEDGAPGQYLKQSVGGNATVGGLAFLTGHTRIADDYRTRLLNARTYRWRGHVLELVPRVSDPQVRRILLYVDARPGTAGVIHRIRIDDHDGNRNKLELRSLRFNRDVPSARFAFRPPSNAIRL